MLLTDGFYLMHTEQKNNNMKCRLISLKIQQLISIFILFFSPRQKLLRKVIYFVIKARFMSFDHSGKQTKNKII